MAGIDNNTVLYLRGDQYKDFSLYSNEKEVTNSGTTINQNGKFGPGIQLTNGIVSITNGSNRIDWSQDFTIEWWEQVLGTIDGNSALLITRVASGMMQNGILLGHGGSAMYTGTGVWDGILGAQVKDSEVNVWHHWALVKSGNLWTMYKDGNLFWTITSEVAPGTMDGGITLGAWIDDTGVHPGYNAVISELRLSNVARYSNTFTPQSEPYTTVNINIITQVNNKVSFEVSKKSANESINKVDVLLNGIVIETFNDGFENISYTIDESLSTTRTNNVEIRAYYFSDNYVSKFFTYGVKDGIDENTILYLRGDSFVDLSLNNYTVSNDDGMALVDSNNFGKALDMTVASKRLNILDAILPTDMFTIDWWEISKGASTANTGLVSTLDNTHTDTAIKGIIMGKSSASAGPKLWSTTPSQTGTWVVSEWAFGNTNTTNWVHRALVYDGNNFYAYENGKLFGTVACAGLAAPSPSHIVIGGYRAQSACYNAHVENLRISNVVRWTGNFEPPTRPYTSVSINMIEQENTHVNFSVTKGNPAETINKVDIVLNGNVIQTYNNGFDNIDYTVDSSLCILGMNDIEIRAYYYGNFYEPLNMVYNKSFEKLPEQPSLIEVVSKLDELKNTYSGLVDKLYTILLNEGCEITNDDKHMTTLINKVEEYTNVVKEEFEDVKEKLVNALNKEKIDVTIDNSFDELISKIKNITDFPSWCVTSGGYWITGANMTTARRFLSSGVVGTNIYCIGGYTGSTSSVNQKYDTLTNTWTAMTAMTASRYGHAVTASKGKIYAMGGYSSVTTNYCYDPSTNAWTTKTAIPSSSYYSATAEADGIIYLISGYVGGSLSTTNRKYDVSTNTWSTISVIPAAVYSPSIGVYKNKIYVVGGYNGGVKNTNYCYDIVKNSWSTLKAKTNTVYRAGQVAPVIDGKLYVIGGTGSSTYLTVNECYDIENNTWSTLTVLPTGRYGLTTQEVNGFIYCIGGYTGSYSSANQCFLPL